MMSAEKSKKIIKKYKILHLHDIRKDMLKWLLKKINFIGNFLLINV